MTADAATWQATARVPDFGTGKCVANKYPASRLGILRTTVGTYRLMYTGGPALGQPGNGEETLSRTYVNTGSRARLLERLAPLQALKTCSRTWWLGSTCD